MKTKHLFLLPALAFLACDNLQAQITIGGLTDPKAGAVLDLNSIGGVKGGLLLSNVNLTNLNDIPVDFIGVSGVVDLVDMKTKFRGAIVYNTNADTGVGVYVWSGSKWQSMKCMTVPELATLGAITGTATVCSGVTDLTYSVPELTGATDYEWDVPGDWEITDGANSNQITVTSGTGGGQISVLAKNSCGNSAEQTLTVTVNNKATPGTITLSKTIINAGGTFTAEIEPVMGAMSYVWDLSDSNGGLTGSSTGTSITITGKTAGTYSAGTIKVATSNGCGDSSPSSSPTVTVIAPGIQIIKDSQNNEYTTYDFGTAGTWMTQNLRSTETVQGGVMKTVPYYYYNGMGTGNMTNTPLYSHPYKNPSILTTNPEYGLFYTWAAANIGVSAEDTNTNPVNRQGICPTGWHLPNETEWSELAAVISASALGEYSTTMGAGVPGTKMKSTTNLPGYYGIVDANGTSKSRAVGGFDALLVGGMVNTANSLGEKVYFWSSSSSSTNNSNHPYLMYNNTGVIWSFLTDKYYLFSVRCKKD
jgi:uncharacterized protein (TIGR02145 family)